MKQGEIELRLIELEKRISKLEQFTNKQTIAPIIVKANTKDIESYVNNMKAEKLKKKFKPTNDLTDKEIQEIEKGY